MDAVGKTISEHFRNNDVGAVATPAIRTIQEWLIAGDLTRQTFDALEPSLAHLDTEELKGLLLDFLMSFAVACSDDLELDDHEMECLRTLTVLFRIEEGDFYQYRRVALHEIVAHQIDIIVDDLTVDRSEQLHLVNLQRVFGLSSDQLASIAHADIIEVGRALYEMVQEHRARKAALERQIASRKDDLASRQSPMFGKQRKAAHAEETASLHKEIEGLEAEAQKDRALPVVALLHLERLQGEFAVSIESLHWEPSEPTRQEEPPKRSRRIAPDVRDSVWRRDEGRCVECGSQDSLEFDHIVPFSKGGSNTYRNIQLLCESCNRAKSDQIG